MSEARWIRFVEVPVPDRRTRCWRVETKGVVGVLLGGVEWYTGWRKYVFEPVGGSDGVSGVAFEEVCLRDIAAFIEARTREHRDALMARKAVAS